MGTFLVGAFAGSAAAIFPRLAVFLSTPTNKAPALEMDAFRTYGKLQIQQIDNKYSIVLEGSRPYSDAVSKAVDVKRMSGNSLNPTLVPAK